MIRFLELWVAKHRLSKALAQVKKTRVLVSGHVSEGSMCLLDEVESSLRAVRFDVRLQRGEF